MMSIFLYWNASSIHGDVHVSLLFNHGAIPGLYLFHLPIQPYRIFSFIPKQPLVQGISHLLLNCFEVQMSAHIHIYIETYISNTFLYIYIYKYIDEYICMCVYTILEKSIFIYIYIHIAPWNNMIVEIPASICFEPLLIRQANGSQTKECEKRSVPFCFIDAIVSTCFCSLRYVMFLDRGCYFALHKV